MYFFKQKTKLKKKTAINIKQLSRKNKKKAKQQNKTTINDYHKKKKAKTYKQ